jgi:hypothetical protein
MILSTLGYMLVRLAAAPVVGALGVGCPKLQIVTV